MQFNIGLFIGRFQPVHHGHLHVIAQGLAQCQTLIILIGSIKRARSVKNPWSYEERAAMLMAALQEYDQQQGTHFSQRVIFRGIEDQLYNDNQWFSDVETIVAEACKKGENIAVVGHDKDASTWYLSRLSHWPLISVDNYQALNATPIRQAYFAKQLATVTTHLSLSCQAFLQDFAKTREYARLAEEYHFIQHYQRQWAHTPYPPIFVTTDAVVTCQHHVLLIRRKHCPGKDLWALPGGFLEVKERIETGLLRELREETAIQLSDETLRFALKKLHTFDHPDRSQIGRVITHAGWLDLPGEFPTVCAADDAADIQWYPLQDLGRIQAQLHDDHYQIIRHFYPLTSL